MVKFPDWQANYRNAASNLQEKTGQRLQQTLTSTKSRRKPQFFEQLSIKKAQIVQRKHDKIIDDIRAHASNGKYVLILKIKDIIINKRNPCIKDLQLNLSYIGRLKQANAINYMASITNLRLSQRQFSQQVHMSMLDDYNFYFSVSQKNIRNEMFAFIQIRQLKGLSYLIVGAFCVPINEKLKQSVNSQTFQLSKVGKCIGHISVQVQIIKKTDFTTSNLIQAKKHRFSQQRMFRTQTNLTHQKTKVDGT